MARTAKRTVDKSSKDTRPPPKQSLTLSKYKSSVSPKVFSRQNRGTTTVSGKRDNTKVLDHILDKRQLMNASQNNLKALSAIKASGPVPHVPLKSLKYAAVPKKGTLKTKVNPTVESDEDASSKDEDDSEDDDEDFENNNKSPSGSESESEQENKENSVTGVEDVTPETTPIKISRRVNDDVHHIEMKSMLKRVLKNQKTIIGGLRENKEMIMNNGKIKEISESMATMKKLQSKKELIKFDSEYYKNPEPAAKMELQAVGLVARLYEICSDYLILTLLVSDIEDLKCYSLCYNRGEFLLIWKDELKSAKTKAGRKFVDRMRLKKRALAEQILDSSDEAEIEALMKQGREIDILIWNTGHLKTASFSDIFDQLKEKRMNPEKSKKDSYDAIVKKKKKSKIEDEEEENTRDEEKDGNGNDVDLDGDVAGMEGINGDGDVAGMEGINGDGMVGEGNSYEFDNSVVVKTDKKKKKSRK